MIPRNIRREHVLRAIEEIKRNGIPKGRNSRKFFLEFNGDYYPPKYVISLANKYVNGKELDPEEFSGGEETNTFLRKLGFNIVKISILKSIKRTQYPKIKEEKFSDIHHNERCPKCKETIRKLLHKIYGEVKVNYKFNVGTSPEDFKHSSYYHKLKEIYKTLQNHRGFKEFVKAKTLPNCDFFIPNPGFIVEFDESQHFTLPRKITLEKYPHDLKLGFNREKWIRLCEEINVRDNDPPYRDEQRAWYDTLRDFLPVILGLKPTVRLFARDFVWCSLNPEDPRDVEKFMKIIEQKQLNTIKVLLAVPSYSPNNEMENLESEITEFSKKEKIDLVIFPEGYIKANFREALKKVKEKFKCLNTAVLTGVETEEGYQLAIFFNPHSQKNETKDHIYIKHSSAKKLAYEYKGYQGKDDKMFNPILLKGKKLGVMVCHDMFFPLIPYTLVKNGAEILIDLTGGNVNFQKWKNIIKGRSIEIKNMFLCTMGYYPKDNQKSYCFAYYCGKLVPMNCFKNRHKRKITNFRDLPDPPYFCVVSIPPSEFKNDQEEPKYSSKDYSDITISLETKKRADIEIVKNGEKLIFSSQGKLVSVINDDLIKVNEEKEVIGLLLFPLKNIVDCTLILKRLRKVKEKVNYWIVLYYGEESTDSESKLLSLAKLRAIENRVGIIVFTNKTKIVLKTTKYKQIQLFNEKEGIFGLNKECLDGPMSIFTQGVPVKFKGKYLELLQEENK